MQATRRCGFTESQMLPKRKQNQIIPILDRPYVSCTLASRYGQKAQSALRWIEQPVNCGAQRAVWLVAGRFWASGPATALAALICAHAAAAENPEQIATALAQKALANSGAMTIISDLTTEIGPRLAGSDAEKRAAVWAKQRFERLGFDKVWIETFPLEHGWARGVEKGEVISPSPQPLIITALGGSVATPPEGIEAEIAWFKTYDELLASPTNSLAGKIAVVTQPLVRVQDGSGYGALNKMRNAGPGEASRRGAIGYLLRSLGTDQHRFPHTGATEYAGDAPRIPAADLSVPDAEQLDRLVAKGAPVRVKLILTPRDLGPVTSQNVIAEIKGREKPDEIILLGAHLDSWDLGTVAIDYGAAVAIAVAAA